MRQADDQAGAVTSPVFTAPDTPGNLYVVETVTDSAGQVVHRVRCGAVNESGVIPQPDKPAITTHAPADATIGDTIRDQADLTGPFPVGVTIQFWAQHTDYVDPPAASDDLACVKPAGTT